MGQIISSIEFRQALAHFACGVTVVAVRGPGGPVGLTATSFTSTSLEPPLVLVCISRSARIHETMVGGEHFGVSILEEGQSWIAAQCAGPTEERFKGVPLDTQTCDGVPIIDGAHASVVCRRYAAHEAGDHTILLGEVLQCRVREGRPLIHYRRAFGSFGVAPDR